MQSSFLNNFGPLSLFSRTGAAICALLLFTGCSSSRKTAHHPPPVYYDFRGASLAVDAPAAPLPEIITNADEDVLNIRRDDPLSVFRAAGAIAKESSAAGARKRIKEAGKEIDVSDLVARNILDGSQSMLGMIPADEFADADFILELFIDRHGVLAGPSYDGRLAFFLDADVALYAPETGERVWGRRIAIEEPVAYNSLFGNLHAAGELSSMEKEEMAEALVRISEYSAESILRNLRRDIYRPSR